MIKFIVTLLILLTLIIILKKRDFFFDKSIQNIDGDLDFEKKYPIECKLFNEIIDRKIEDLERQCYYECDTDDIVRLIQVLNIFANHLSYF